MGIFRGPAWTHPPCSSVGHEQAHDKPIRTLHFLFILTVHRRRPGHLGTGAVITSAAQRSCPKDVCGRQAWRLNSVFTPARASNSRVMFLLAAVLTVSYGEPALRSARHHGRRWSSLAVRRAASNVSDAQRRVGKMSTCTDEHKRTVFVHPSKHWRMSGNGGAYSNLRRRAGRTYS